MFITVDSNPSYRREWRQRISAWFVDLENGGGTRTTPEENIKEGHSEPKKGRSAPPVVVTPGTSRRLHRLKDPHLRTDGALINNGQLLATLPEGDVPSEPEVSPPVDPTRKVPYKRVYADRKPSVQLNTDVVGAMETIEGKTPGLYSYRIRSFKVHM